MRNTALAFSIVMIIFLLGKNLYAIDTTYIENKKGGFIYKEDLEGNQFIFYGTNIVISTKIRSCDIYFTKSEESIPKLMSRKCVN